MDDNLADVRRAWVQRVLGVALAGAEVGTPQSPPGPKPGGVSPRIAFTQSRLLWDSTRKQVQADLRRLEEAVLKETADEPDAATIAGNSKILYTVLDYLDERLIDKLDEALNAQAPEERRKFEAEARGIIEEYTDYMQSDELLRDIDDSGFIELKIKETVAAQLASISGNLKALAG